MPPEHVSELVSFMVAEGILWSDNGILAFASKGESTFGRQNFMDILSVFTSPPLFTVMSGQKVLGSVHESTFYKREDGPAILVLSGRSWKTKNLDWKRRIAHVEPTDESGRSRWLGEGQMISHAVCQSIRRLLASNENDPTWSRRAVQQFTDLRDENPWVSTDATSLVRMANGQLRWWTFAGGVANTLLADSLKKNCDVKSDNFSLVFPNTSSLEAVFGHISSIRPEDVKPIPNIDAMDSLKFSECLPPRIAAEVFTSRFDDRPGVAQALGERLRVVP
jgi:ATP-dependent Lhr-like helicase